MFPHILFPFKLKEKFSPKGEAFQSVVPFVNGQVLAIGISCMRVLKKKKKSTDKEPQKLAGISPSVFLLPLLALYASIYFLNKQKATKKNLLSLVPRRLPKQSSPLLTVWLMWGSVLAPKAAQSRACIATAPIGASQFCYGNNYRLFLY